MWANVGTFDRETSAESVRSRRVRNALRGHLGEAARAHDSGTLTGAECSALGAASVCRSLLCAARVPRHTTHRWVARGRLSQGNGARAASRSRASDTFWGIRPLGHFVLSRSRVVLFGTFRDGTRLWDPLDRFPWPAPPGSTTTSRQVAFTVTGSFEMSVSRPEDLSLLRLGSVVAGDCKRPGFGGGWKISCRCLGLTSNLGPQSESALHDPIRRRIGQTTRDLPPPGQPPVGRRDPQIGFQHQSVPVRSTRVFPPVGTGSGIFGVVRQVLLGPALSEIGAYRAGSEEAPDSEDGVRKGNVLGPGPESSIFSATSVVAKRIGFAKRVRWTSRVRQPF